MTTEEIINELDSIISYCDVAKEKATGLREKLSRFHDSASPKRGKKLSDEVVAKVFAARQKHLNKKAKGG